jgi:hypothetical protein
MTTGEAGRNGAKRRERFPHPNSTGPSCRRLKRLPPRATSAFLRAGVPPELTRAALRRAWAVILGIRISSASPTTLGLQYAWRDRRLRAARDERRGSPSGRADDRKEPHRGDQAAPTPEDAPREPSPIETSTGFSTLATPTDEIQSKGGIAPREPADNDSEAHNFRALPQRTQEDIAARNNPELPDDSLASDRRPHGRALPK